MNALFAAAKEVCDFMKARRWEFCVIGGLAVQRWGEPRLTQDADLTLLTGFEHKDWLDAEGLVARQGTRLKRAYIMARLRDLSEAVYRPEILTVARRVLEGKSWRK